jgi:hypothetical protein
MHLISYTKDQQLKHHKARKAAKTAKQKGNDGEKAVQAELQKFSKKPVKRNHQGREGGGLSNSDISALDTWDIEVKTTERLSVPEWLRTLKAETPPNKKPGLVFAFEEEPWLVVKLKDRMNLASDLIEAAGGEVYFP